MHSHPHLTIVSSPYSVSESLDRLIAVLHEKNIKIFARFNHGQEAHDAGLQLPDTEVLVFGDPKIGTFLMQEDRTIAIELPLRVLCWQTNDDTKLAYENLELTTRAYDISEHVEIINKMNHFMHTIITTVVSD